MSRQRAHRSTAKRYEHPNPGDLLHIDVKKRGRIPDGGGWLTPRSTRTSRAPPRPGSLPGPRPIYAERGITSIRRVTSDSAFAYRRSLVFREAVEQLGATEKFIKPHCPWQNGRIERLNRTLANE